jgi:hypothetical protein
VAHGFPCDFQGAEFDRLSPEQQVAASMLCQASNGNPCCAALLFVLVIFRSRVSLAVTRAAGGGQHMRRNITPPQSFN